MRLLLLLLTVSSVAGCAKPQPVHTAPAASSPSPQVISLSEEEVAQVKQKFHLLRPDMTVQEALSALGLASYRGRLQEFGAHSGMTGGIGFMLAEGHRFRLSYADVGEHSTRILETDLDDQVWRASDVSAGH